MYRVTVKTDGTEYLLHAPLLQNMQIYDDELSEEMGKTPTYRFTIPASHPNADKILPLSSEIFVYRDDEVLFFGRDVSPSTDLYNTRTIECVGALSYLADSMIAPFSHTGTLNEFLQAVISKHNSMVETRKQFTLGRVAIAGETGYREVTDYTDALSLLSNLIVGAYGGYLRVRLENNIRYLDYVDDYGGANSQQVRFGENVLDLTRQIDASDVITCLVAQGAQGEDGSRPTVTARDNAAINRWGQIWEWVSFDGIADAATLQSVAASYLADKTNLPEKIEFNALDLHLVDVDIDALKLGYWTHFYSDPHGIEGDYLLRKRTLHVTAPQNDTVTFGSEIEQTLTGTSLADKKEAELANEALQEDMESYADGAVEQSEQKTTEKFAEYKRDIDGIESRVGTVETTQTEQGKQIEENTSLISQTASSIRTEVSQKITKVEGDIQSVEEYTSSVEQTAQKINWVVASGTSASNFTLTDRAINLVASSINITADKIVYNGYQTSGYIQWSGSSLVIYNSGGDVEIGNPSDWVSVNGRFYVAGISLMDDWLTIRSGCTAQSWETSSDKKVKTDIKDIPETISSDLIAGLKPVQYRYKTGDTERLHFGFIAQDVLETVEQIGYGEDGLLVNTAQRFGELPEDVTLVLNYTDIIAPLVATVQQLSRRVEELEGKINGN